MSLGLGSEWTCLPAATGRASLERGPTVVSGNIPYMSRDDDLFDDSWIAGIALPLAFFCRSCRGRAQMVEADGALHRVECLTCGIALEGSDVQDMHEHLLNPLREQEGADILRRIGRREGTLGSIDNSGRR